MQLDPNVRIVDLCLTDLGKELLAKGDPNFKITKFAVADDEIDYNLFDTSQVDSDNYGIYLTNMPVLEASVFSSTALRNKLVTLPAGSTKIPILKVEPSAPGNIYENQEIIIKPSILNYTLKESQMNFTAILRNTNLGTLEVNEPTPTEGGGLTTIAASQIVASPNLTFVSTDQTERVQVATGKTFKFRAAPDVSTIDSEARTTTIEIYGNIVGGAQSISITVVHSDATVNVI